MRLIYTLFLVAFFGFVSLAQDNTLDLTFNPTDTGFKNGDGPYNTLENQLTHIDEIAMQSDGKILIGGQFTEYNGRTSKSLVRLNADGTSDTTFTLDVLIEVVEAIIVQPNGKIIVGGIITNLNGDNRKNIVRLNSDGSLDATFNVTVGQESWVTSKDIVLQPDGKVLMSTSDYPSIYRVDGNGVLDPTFNFVGVSGVNSIALQSDGRLIVGGNFTANFGGVTANRLARINSDGSFDATFNTTVGADSTVRKVLVLPNGKIAIIGTFEFYDGVYRPRIARLNSDGALDTTFNPGYFIGATSVLASMAVQPDGKLLVVGKYALHGSTPMTAAATSVNNIVRLNLDGSRDTTYSITGADKYIYDIAVQPNGNIIVCGEFETHDNVARRRISRSLSNGTIDMTFNTGSGSNPLVREVKVLPDNKIIIVGDFRLYNGVVRNRIAKLNADGTLDSSFVSSLLINEAINTCEIQSDGKIIVGGNFTNFGGLPINRIARLNSDGSLDYSFIIGSGFNESFIGDIALQNDGKIIVVGNFTTYNGVVNNRIVRLNADGSLDTTFNVGSGANFIIATVEIQSDGKILIGGQFTTFNGVNKNGILRLNADGSTDTSFLSGTGLDGNAVFCIRALTNGKILVASRSVTYNGAAVGSMFRLNSDGTRDTTFINVGHSREFTNFIIQPDGKILALNSGSSTSGTNNVVFYLNRLSANGAYDTSFGVATMSQFKQQPYSLGLQSDGKIIVGGHFDSFKNQGKNRVARINNTVTLEVDEFLQDDTNVLVYKENNSLYVDSRGTILRAISVYDLNGKLLYENKNISSSKFALDEIKSNNQILLFKIIDGEGKVSDLKSIF